MTRMKGVPAVEDRYVVLLLPREPMPNRRASSNVPAKEVL